MTPLSFRVGGRSRLSSGGILRSRPDTVICIEPTLLSAPAAIVAAKIVGARRALHVHDLEVDAAFAVGHLEDRGVYSRLPRHSDALSFAGST